MAEVKFGMAGLQGETPKPIKIAYRVLMLASLLWATTIQPNMHLSDHLQAAINQWLIIGNTGIYQICQFFGWSKAS